MRSLSKTKASTFSSSRSVIGMFLIFAAFLILLAMMWRQAVNLEQARRAEALRTRTSVPTSSMPHAY